METAHSDDRNELRAKIQAAEDMLLTVASPNRNQVEDCEPHSNGSSTALELARRFHRAYENIAPSFGYTTREDTRVFDPASQNGKLMVATCQHLAFELDALRSRAEAAEAEVGTMKHSIESWNELVQELQAEVARLENLVDSAYMRGCEVSGKAWRKDATVAALDWSWMEYGYWSQAQGLTTAAMKANRADYIQRGLAALLDGRVE